MAGRPVNLTAGVAHGVVWEGDVHRRTDQSVELPVGRAALLGPVQCVEDVPAGPFLWRTDRVEIGALLALGLQGLSGVLLTRADGIGRHGLTLAAGMGIPIVLYARGRAGQACTIGGNGYDSERWPVQLPPAARVVQPIHQGGRTSIELVSGQPEELALVAPHIQSGAVAEVGLVRIEHLVLLDPGMEAGDLIHHLTRILTAVRGTPTAVRPASWGPDKPCPEAFTLSSAEQYACLHEAARAVDHGSVTALRRQGDPLPEGLAWAPFLESASARATPDKAAWVGLGDLSRDTGSAEALQSAVDRFAREAGGPLRLCGVAAPWAAQEGALAL